MEKHIIIYSQQLQKLRERFNTFLGLKSVFSKKTQIYKDFQSSNSKDVNILGPLLTQSSTLNAVSMVVSWNN